jgi:hypothetical protein
VALDETVASIAGNSLKPAALELAPATGGAAAIIVASKHADERSPPLVYCIFGRLEVQIQLGAELQIPQFVEFELDPKEMKTFNNVFSRSNRA